MLKIAHNFKIKDFKILYNQELDKIKENNINMIDIKKSKGKIKDNNYREY